MLLLSAVIASVLERAHRAKRIQSQTPPLTVNSVIFTNSVKCMGGSSGGGGGGYKGSGLPLKNHKNIGFLSNIGPDTQNNHKATKPAFNVGPSSGRTVKRHLNGVSLADG